MAKTKRTTVRKKAAEPIDARLPVPPELDRVSLEDLTRAHLAITALGHYDRARAHLLACQQELAKVGIELRGVDAVLIGGAS